MAFDKLIALFFLVISFIYGYAAYTYPLLPFERNMSFLPNTLPQVLSVLGIIVSGIIVLAPKKEQETDEDDDEMSLSKFKKYKTGQAVSLLIAMVVYALCIRPLGFIPSTVIFIVASGWILGERKPIKMTGIALIATVFIWYLVQEVLGIFLKPLPIFM
jgi:putative tricarboxylic transport membrane protein